MQTVIPSSSPAQAAPADAAAGTGAPQITEQRLIQAQEALGALKAEIERRLFGQSALVVQGIIGLLARGNVLIEGQPGLGKTLLVRVMSEALHLDFSRIQFTPDLMPADITGSQSLVHDEQGRASLEFRAGPVFSNIVLADEINRATPKTQSALLEAMQEQSVTVAGGRRPLPAPFMVIATQNPIEMEGTYPLPEAQLDRFLLKLEIAFPSFETLRDIGLHTTGQQELATTRVMDKQTLLSLQALVREIAVAPHVAEHAARLTLATHPDAPDAPESIRKYVRYGASPRAMQALILAGRAHALLCGRAWMSEEDIHQVAHPVLRHRMIPSFDAKLENVTNNDLVDQLLASAAQHVRATG
ncbi:MAG: AAA family ATPase [Deltaproteobacteria bacterium]|nr:AAA family ATPase [Deltaproteobacteria bacterium]